MSVKLNDKNMKDFGLILLDGYHIATPQVKKQVVNIPGIDGAIDLTEALTGHVPYGNRLLELEFKYLSDSGKEYHIVQSEVMNFCHGKEVKVIFDNDSKFYWIGRASVESSKERGYQTILIEVDVKPHKYNIYSSVEDWLWDPFDFLVDYANELKDLIVTGSLETTVIGSIVPTNPIITSDEDMEILFEAVTYPIKKGTFTYYSIDLKDGENKLLFKGNGVVTIDVRGGSL